jgi:hypothetical protein
MKLFLSLLLFVLGINANSNLIAQDDYFNKPIPVKETPAKIVGEKDVLIDAYYGIPYLMGALVKMYYEDSAQYYGYTISDIRNTNHIGLRAEFMISEKVGLGAEYSFAHFWVLYRDPYNSYQSSIRKQRLMVKLNIHFSTSKNFDPYLNFGAGYRTTKYYTSSTNVNYQNEQGQLLAFFPIALRVGFGFRYFITSHFGLSSEVGIGGPLVQFGLNYKI